MQFIPWSRKRVGDYLDLTIKFHDYSSFFTAFDVASYSEYLICTGAVAKKDWSNSSNIDRDC